MELMHLQYSEVMCMPVKRFYDMLEWKTKLEDEKKKLLQEKKT